MENWSKQARVAEHYLELAQNKKYLKNIIHTHIYDGRNKTKLYVEWHRERAKNKRVNKKNREQDKRKYYICIVR